MVCLEDATARPTELAWLAIRRTLDRNSASWNGIASWLKELECLHRTAV